MDLNDLTFILERLPPGKHVVEAIPAPTGGNGGINPHLSRFVLNTGETVDVFHVKPIYYAHVEGGWRPLSEIATHYASHSIVLREDWADKIELAYLAWLIKRMELVGGTVSIPSPFSAPIPLSEIARPGYAQIHLSTLTSYPDPDPETTTVDGFVLYENASWSTCRSAATGSVASDSSSTFDLRVNTNYRIARLFTLFDTSALTAAATISAADLSLYKTTGDGQDDAGGKSVYVVQTTPASNTALTTSDFDDVGSTSGGSSAVSSGWINATTGYQTVSLNGTGIGWISKTGITKLGLRGSYDFDNVTPGSRLHINDLGTSEQSGTTQDPKLVITYTASTNHTKTLTEAATATATFSRAWTLARTLTEAKTATASIIKTATKLLTGAVTAADTFTKGLAVTAGPNSPGTLANDATVGSTAWTNPSNAGASDNSYAVASGIGAFSAYAGANGTGVEDGPVKMVKGGTIGGSDLSTLANYPTTDTYISYGGPTTLWGLSWAPADINASDFGVAVSARETKFDDTAAQYLKATNFGFSIPTTGTINGIKVEVELKADAALPATHTDAYIDHIRITVYYTQPGNSYTQTLTETATAAASLIKTATRAIAEGVTATATFSRLWTLARTLTESAASAAVILKTSTRTATETASASDNLTALRTIPATLSEALTAAASLVRSAVRQFAEAATAADTFTGLRGIFPTFTEAAVASATMLKTTAKRLSDTAQAASAIIRSSVRTLSDEATAEDTFTGLRFRSATLSEAATAVAAVVRTTTRTLTEGISAASSFVGGFARILTEAATATDAISAVRHYARTLIEAITASDTFARAVTYARSLVEAVTATDTVRRLLNGVAVIWGNIARVAGSAFLNRSRNSATWAERDRGNADWDNRPRNHY